jgi:hypothetical protein
MANSDSVILYTADNGNLVLVYPADNCGLTVKQIQAKDIPSGKTSYILNKSAVPTDRSFRWAWKFDGSAIEVDMTKAKEIHKENIRKARISKLAELDIEFQRALETGASTTDIVSKKQALRDAPSDSAIASADTEAKLKAQWNTSILGASPYS